MHLFTRMEVEKLFPGWNCSPRKLVFGSSTWNLAAGLSSVKDGAFNTSIS